MSDFDNDLSSQFRRMDARKDQLFQLLRSLPIEKYLQQPHPQSWSAGQAANHLYLSEKNSFAYIRKKLSYPDDVPKYHIKSRWSAILYRLIFIFSKAKAPQQINMWEGQEVFLPDDLEQKWNKLRSEMKSFIQEKYQHFPHHLVYKHPFAGRLTFKQMLAFFSDHMDHHIRQIKRIIKEVAGK